MRQIIPNLGNIKDGHTLRYDLMLTNINIQRTKRKKGNGKTNYANGQVMYGCSNRRQGY